jgi:Bacterial type II/III secretion system short domain
MRIPAFIFALAAGLPMWAQPTPDVARMIQIHYVDVNRLEDLLRMNGVMIRADAGMHVLVVSGRPDVVAAIDEMVKKLDVPPAPQPEFELTGYLVSGSSQSRNDEIPNDLAAAIRQLHGLFSYKSYRLIDTFFIHAGSPFRHESTSGTIPGSDSDYDFAYDDASVSGTTVHLTELRLNIQPRTLARLGRGAVATAGADGLAAAAGGRGPFLNRTFGIHTSLDVPEGQKIVVGKSSVPGGDDALILVLSVKLIK